MAENQVVDYCGLCGYRHTDPGSCLDSAPADVEVELDFYDDEDYV